MTRQIVFRVLVLALFGHIAQSNPDKNAGYLLHVCKEDSIKRFAGTSIDPTEELSVSIHHNKTTDGLWTYNESKCYQKICRDGNSDIWLNGFNESDNGSYTLLYQRRLYGPTEKEKKKTFQVTIPPLPSCKPRFDYVQLDSISGSLTAFLPEIGCGIPPVTLYWFSGPNRKYNKEDFANLSQGSLIHLRVNSLENPGVYIACIEGPALRCVKNQSHTDFCYDVHIPEFKDDGTQFSTIQSIDRMNGTHWIVTIIILTFKAVTMQCFVSLIIHHEKIKNIIQNNWRHWRHGEARNVGDQIHDDPITMFRQEKQPNLDDFKRNVRRGSHIALKREKGSYTHHMLVTEVDNNAIKVIEYGSPTDIKSMTRVALAKNLGKIHEKQIKFDELFGPNASDVFLVYCDDYPETDEERNAAIQRAESRLGEKQYCSTCNNCEHFVTWALTGKPISMQWINAGAFCRCKADFLTAIVTEVFSDIQLLVQKYLSNIKVFLQCLSKLKEKCLKYLPKGEAFDKLRADISSIRKIDVLLVILLSLYKIVTFLTERRHSVGETIFEVIKIVGLQICSILLGVNSQLLEILEKLDLWRRNYISTLDMLRKLFKNSMSYLVILALAICLPASIPLFIQVLGKSVITGVVSSVAGFVFDIGHMILLKLLSWIKTLFLQGVGGV